MDTKYFKFLFQLTTLLSFFILLIEALSKHSISIFILIIFSLYIQGAYFINRSVFSKEFKRYSPKVKGQETKKGVSSEDFETKKVIKEFPFLKSEKLFLFLSISILIAITILII